MLWIKAFHIIFVVTWFAGLFYLPRLFVYHAGCDDAPGVARFLVMERRLLAITNIGGAGALIFGTALLWWWSHEFTSGSFWLHAKLTLVLALIVFHLYCARLVRAFRDDRNRHGERFFRAINEIPAVLLLTIVILVVVKPF